MEVLDTRDSLPSYSWRISQLFLSIVLSFIAAQCIYLVCSINILVGYTILSLVIVFLAFSRYSMFLVNFYCWSVLYQNALIAFSSGFIPDSNTFSILHGTNFFITTLLFVLLSIRSLGFVLKSSLFTITFFVLVLLGIFCGIGVYLYGFKNSFVYFRLFSMVFMMFWIGVYFSSLITESSFRTILKTILLLTLISIVGQFLFPELFLTLMNDVDYYALKGEASSMEEVIQILYSNTYFNISSFGQAIRAPGFIKSFISSAYFVICLSILLYWNRNKYMVLISFIIMSVCVASKGAFICFFFFLILYYLNKKFKFNIQAALFILLFLWIPLVFIGYTSYNEHLIGFVSGLSYLDTFGNGLGFSGNLSDIRLASYSGIPLPDQGYWTRFYNGSESALGVLFSSLGAFSIIYLYLLFRHLFRIYPILKNNNLDYIALLSIVMVFQGIFQEEAFSPYAFGMVLFIAGYYFNYRSYDEAEKHTI